VSDLTQAELQSEVIEDLGRFTHDPLGYVLYNWAWGEGELKDSDGPRDWQRGVLTDIGERLKAGGALGAVVQEAIASGHGIGKSALVSWIIKWALATFEDTKGVVTASTDNQLRTKTWPEVAKWHRLGLDQFLFKLTATALYSADPKHERTWRVDILPWSEHNTEAFAGLHNQGKRIVLVFDEGSGIADRIWEVSEGALTDEGTEILWCAFGNPTRATGRFRECFRKFRHRWNTSQIDSRTVDGTNKTQIAKWVEDYGEDSDFIKVRVRGVFPAMSAKQFISETDVDAAFGRELMVTQYNFAPKILTCDPAWEGDDELVIGMRQGLYFQVLLTMAKNDNDVNVANILARLEDEHKADAVFIDGGYGTGIVSVARTLGRSWRLVWFSEKAFDTGCLNKRAEMWKLMRDWLKEGGAIPPDNVLRDDLLSPETVPRLDGKLQLEPKDAMKRRGLNSPNRGDALALSFAYPVNMKSKTLGDKPPMTLHEYDPFKVEA